MSEKEKGTQANTRIFDSSRQEDLVLVARTEGGREASFCGTGSHTLRCLSAVAAQESKDEKPEDVASRSHRPGRSGTHRSYRFLKLGRLLR